MGCGGVASITYATSDQKLLIMDNSVRSRGWIFVINNPEPSDYPDWQDKDNVVFSVYQLEEGETGTPHIQGYVYFKSLKHFDALKARLPRAHLERAIARPAQNVVYCTKPDGRLAEPVFYGTCPQQGKRNDLLSFRDAVLTGATDGELVTNDDHFSTYAKHPALADRIRYVLSKPRFLDEPPTVIVLIGIPGSGKSHYTREKFPDAYYKPVEHSWWPGYADHDSVVLEDFNGSTIPFTSLKVLLDKGPFTAPVKNGHANVTASTFVISTNFAPRYWYSADVLGDHGESALLRRITKFIFFEIRNGLRCYAEVSPEDRELFIDKINANFK